MLSSYCGRRQAGGLKQDVDAVVKQVASSRMRGKKEKCRKKTSNVISI